MRTRAQWLRLARFHRRPIRTCVVLILVLAGAFGLDAGAARQAPPSSAPQDSTSKEKDKKDKGKGTAATGERPQFRVQANLVRVDVFPTKDGKPIRDLTAADFEVLEDGVPQKVETFEHVDVSGQIPQEERQEPNTMREARSMAEDPRSRIFIIFLDTYHTEVSGSHRMQKVLVDLLDRIIGPEDLFGVMTPEMSATDVTLSRRTQTTAGFLAKYWYWGRRDRISDRDPVEQMYESCFPEHGGTRTCADPRDPTGNATATDQDPYRGVAKEMIQRRREKRVLDALGDLSIYLQGLREERKAVIAVSDGWLLYRPNQALERIGLCGQPPTGPQVGVGPTGRLTTDLPRDQGNYSQQTCSIDRQHLANLDDWQTFRDLLDRANRANVSFYPIDSRGLPAFDTGIDEDTATTIGVPVQVDHALLTARIENLRTLADATDGLAVVENNNIELGVRRIVDDLTSYYLLGYYSTNAKLDGRFRSIKVRVKRPGVDVRARRGYKAATEEELTRGRELSAKAEVTGPPPAFQSAMAALASVRPDFRFVTSVSWLAAPLDDSVPGAKSHLWVVGEMDQATAKSPEWASGAEAEVLLTAEDGVKIAELTRQVPAPVHVISITVPDIPLGPGDYALRLRVKPTGGGLPFMDTVRFNVADTGDLTGKPRLLRRGLATGVQYVATADPRFRRTDRLRVEIPLLGAIDGASGELLDKNGQVMPVPIEASTRHEDAALQWASADATLAPLAPGDYAIRTTIQRGSTKQQVLTAFRIVP